ncbi:MAG: hypothetical protein HZB23_16025 [Deltaproteobacteria bacterium]|nr:hypothetical protein [Deltaproteobacteria bacterium]
MNIDGFELLKLTVSAVTGGAMGSIITILAARLARRAKQVAIEIDVMPLLPHKLDGKSLDAKVELSIRDTPRQFAKLFVGHESGTQLGRIY